MDDRAELIRRLRHRADTMNGTQPIGAGDGNDYAVGYYSAGDVLLDRDAAAALEAPHPVKVKALEWEEVTAERSKEEPIREPTGDYEAVSPIGIYYIEQYFSTDSYGWRVTLNGSDDVADRDDPNEAKAAAQADYEKRIRSALEAAPAVPDGCAELTGENEDICPGCGDGDKVPASGYWRCPVCDTEWNEDDVCGHPAAPEAQGGKEAFSGYGEYMPISVDAGTAASPPSVETIRQETLDAAMDEVRSVWAANAPPWNRRNPLAEKIVAESLEAILALSKTEAGR